MTSYKKKITQNIIDASIEGEGKASWVFGER